MDLGNGLGCLFPKIGALEGLLDDVVQVALAGHALQTRAERDVLVDGLGERVGLLEDHAHATAQVDRVNAIGVDLLLVTPCKRGPNATFS